MSEKDEKNLNKASEKKEDAENNSIKENSENTEETKPAKEEKPASKPESEKSEKVKTEPANSKQPASEKPEKKDRAKGESPWKSVAILLAALIIGFGGGWFGGHLSAKSEIADLKEELAQNQQSISWPNFFNNFGGSGNGNGSGSSSGESQESPNKAALGIMVQDTQNGVEIVDFTAGTNASEAGLQKGDIIVKVNDTSVSSVSELRSALADKEAGDTVSITVTRDGKQLDPVDVKLIDNTAKSEHSDFPDGSNIQG